VGYAYAGLNENEFRTVRSADGQDLFSLVNQQDTSDDFVLGVALQSRPLAAGGQFRALASLGTGIAAPGEHVYLGGGALLFDSLIISGGVVSGDTTRGSAKIVEKVFGGGESRELFGTIATSRVWRPYVSVSFKVY
jgi:hypothetical protein